MTLTLENLKTDSYNSFIAGASFAKPKWISIKDSLLEAFIDVFVIIPHGTGFIRTVSYCDVCGLWNSDIGGGYGKPTHWMYIPKYPNIK